MAESRKNNDYAHLWHQSEKSIWLRWLLGIIILGMVFGLGFKLGEFKAQLENGWGFPGGYYGGYNMMRGYNWGDYGNYYGPWMMNGYYGAPRQATSTPK